MAVLVVLRADGLQLADEIALPYGEILIGRDERCTLRIDTKAVSRKHARIYFNGDAWVIEDLQSTNGCFVNELRGEHSVLHDSDVLRIGPVIFRFVEGAASTAPAGRGGGGGHSPALLPSPFL